MYGILGFTNKAFFFCRFKRTKRRIKASDGKFKRGKWEFEGPNWKFKGRKLKIKNIKRKHTQELKEMKRKKKQRNNVEGKLLKVTILWTSTIY